MLGVRCSNLSAKGRWLPPSEFYSPEKCSRCGVCCGSTDGHPCEHLRRNPDGAYTCEIYENRLGSHRTVDGIPFTCVPIQRVIESHGGYPGCAYVEEIRHIRESVEQDASDLGRREHP